MPPTAAERNEALHLADAWQPRPQPPFLYFVRLGRRTTVPERYAPTNGLAPTAENSGGAAGVLAARHGGKASQRGWEARLGAEASSPDGYSSEGGGGGGGGAGVEIISSIRLFPRKQRGCAPARRQEGEGDARDGAPARASRRRLPSSGLLCGRPSPRVGPSAQQIFLKVGDCITPVSRAPPARREWRHSIIKTFFSFCVLNQLAVVCFLLSPRRSFSPLRRRRPRSTGGTWRRRRSGRRCGCWSTEGNRCVLLDVIRFPCRTCINRRCLCCLARPPPSRRTRSKLC